MFIAVATVECALVWAVLRPSSYSHSWIRALFAAILAIGALVFFAMGLMHSPLYMFVHALWLAFGSLLLLALALSSGVAALRMSDAS